ncbi:MAG: Ankyrin [uncultured bacterium]|nr:MAG: Ankyrin [uncultured bacterium]
MRVYKFYINALYVAITRAISDIYIIEDRAKHPLIELLGLKNVSDSVTLAHDESSLEEWRQEVHKLELQGKTEQADEIKNTIFGQKQTPWQAIDEEQLAILQNRAFDTAKVDKEARLSLFEYAVVYNHSHIIDRLKALNFKPAHGVDHAKKVIEEKYYSFYGFRNFSKIIADTNTYGIDFRNQFNQTPLMIAGAIGHVPLVQYLVENGANISLVDGIGRNPLQLILFQSYFSHKYAQTKLEELYKLLAPSSISIKVEDRLIKIDNRMMEFFLFNLMAAIFHDKSAEKHFCSQSGFCTEDFLQPLEKFPESVLLTRRKKRGYISSILSKNEVNRDDRYNRKLFLRTSHGRYILNPKLEIKIQDEWCPLYTLVGIKEIIPLRSNGIMNIEKHFDFTEEFEGIRRIQSQQKNNGAKAD